MQASVVRLRATGSQADVSAGQGCFTHTEEWNAQNSSFSVELFCGLRGSRRGETGAFLLLELVADLGLGAGLVPDESGSPLCVSRARRPGVDLSRDLSQLTQADLEGMLLLCCFGRQRRHMGITQHTHLQASTVSTPLRCSVSLVVYIWVLSADDVFLGLK